MPRCVQSVSSKRGTIFCGLFLLIGLLTPNSLRAESSPAAQKILVEPGKFELHDQRSRQQLLVTGIYGENDNRDVTHLVKITSSNPDVVRVENTIAVPVANGSAKLQIKLDALEAFAEVIVSHMDQPAPVSFKNETLAALTKAGCNMGACHGSPSGKAGFRLSLRAFDPELDLLTLRTEFYGRRTNILAPENSLILRKGLMEVAHGGGRRLTKNGPAYNALKDWIAEGMRVDADNVPNLEKIEVFPKKRVFQPGANQQQLQVTGFFSDGQTRDLTALTTFSSSNESVGTVTPSGIVERGGRGETAILARYLGRMATSEITFLENVPGFVWSNPPTENFVDELTFNKLKQLKILPSELCTDEEFLRRAYLDTTGRLPRIEETKTFIEDSRPDKREKLVDQLLASDDFAKFWTLKWSDVLRSKSQKLQSTGVQKFHRWIYDSIYHDKPLNQFASELLTAKGSVFENPAASYWRISRDPNDSVETTAQLFLGIRMQCAKCHNHPFERWSQDNYYGVAAAFARIGRKTGPRSDEEIIFVKSSGEIQQPRTKQTMPVHLLLEGEVKVPNEQDRRVVFAEWLTRKDNPFFSKASVNRIWGHLMGRGLVEPVDDFRDSNPPSNASLLDELAQQFAENDFSRKWAIRKIMTSRTYQLSSRSNEFNADDEIYNSHAATRLLTAEQLLDAICQVTGVNEKFSGVPAGTRAVELADPPANHYFLKVFGQPQREMACQCERSNESNLSQALQMINGPVVHNKLRSGSSRIVGLINAKKSDEEIIQTLYLAAVSRKPNAAEQAAAKKHIANSSDRKLALEDIGWAILNTKEFLFQH